MALACICWAIDNNLTALVYGFTPAQSTLVKGVTAGAFNLTIGIWFERNGHHRHPHEQMPAFSWHIHPHVHEAHTHTHDHVPDVHHRHVHG